MKTNPAIRARLRELSRGGDDYDRAVSETLDDLEAIPAIIDAAIVAWQQRCADFPAIYNQGNVLRQNISEALEAAAPASAAEPSDPFIVKERDLLRQAVIRYCDHSRMGTVEPPELQHVIDDAFASRQETP